MERQPAHIEEGEQYKRSRTPIVYALVAVLGASPLEGATPRQISSFEGGTPEMHEAFMREAFAIIRTDAITKPYEQMYFLVAYPDGSSTLIHQGEGTEDHQIFVSAEAYQSVLIVPGEHLCAMFTHTP